MFRISNIVKRGIFYAVVFVLHIISDTSGQTPVLTITSNTVKIGSNFTVTCNVITNSVIQFFLNDNEEGSCPPPFLGQPCNPTDIKQDTTAGETSWTLTAETGYEGSWKCSRSSVNSTSIAVNMYNCPNAIISESGITTNVTLNDTATVTIKVKIDCIYPAINPEISLQFMSSDSPSIPSTIMSCSQTTGTCSAGSAFECTQLISFDGTTLSSGSPPFEKEKSYSLNINVEPSTGTCNLLAIFESYRLMFETTGGSGTDGKRCEAATFLLVIWFNLRFHKIGKVVLIFIGVVVDLLFEIIFVWGMEYGSDFKLIKSDINCRVVRIGVICHVVAVMIEIVKVVVQYLYIEELRARMFVCRRPDGKIKEVRKSDVEEHPSHTLLPAYGDDRKGPSANNQSKTLAKPEDIIPFVHCTVPRNTVNKWVTEESASIENNPKYVSNDGGTLLIKSATEKNNGIYQGILTSDGNEQRVNVVLHVTGHKLANLIINPLFWRQVKAKKLEKTGDLKEIRRNVSRNHIESIPMDEKESNVKIMSIRWEHNEKITQSLSKYKDGDDFVPLLKETRHQPKDEYHCTVDCTNKKSHVYIFIVKFIGVRSGNTPQSTAMHENKVNTVEEKTSCLPPLRHTTTKHKTGKFLTCYP